jgi:hypothetical protein
VGKTLGSERDEVRGDWTKLHSEKLHDPYCPRNIIRVMKPNRMRGWNMCQVWWIREIFFVEKPEGKRQVR